MYSVPATEPLKWGICFQVSYTSKRRGVWLFLVKILVKIIEDRSNISDPCPLIPAP
jgi:hypothetical protein